MHEMSLMSGLFDIIDHTIEQHGLTRVTRVVLGVGAAANVITDCLDYCFRALAKGTHCEEAELVINNIPVLLKCRTCNKEFTAEDVTTECLNCGSRDLKITGGTELIIESLEAD
ncbi:MAG: hydrogenase maturation nickel metallochaperone HypA [Bacillota bacterium]|jgi:hydrogenase nickel incorporation protein HypA/HybF